MSAGRSDRSSNGRRNSPVATRFQKGQSGRPRGRPKDRHREAPYETVLGQLVTVREGGTERRITAAEAFLLHLAKRGLEGDSSAARAAMQLLENIRDKGIVKERTLIIFWGPPQCRKRQLGAASPWHGETARSPSGLGTLAA